MKRKLLLFLCVAVIIMFSTCGCNRNTVSNKANSSTPQSTLSSSSTLPDSSSESSNHHIKKELDTNLTVDADVIQPAKKAYSTYSMVAQSFTQEELSKFFFKNDNSKQTLQNSANKFSLRIETADGASIAANDGRVYYKERNRDSTIDSILNEYRSKHRNNDTATDKSLSFLSRADAVKQGADLLRSLNLSCEPSDQPVVTALTGKELDAFQAELLKDDDYRNFPKTKIIKDWTEQNDSYQIRYTFEKDGIPVYGSDQEPQIYMHYDDPYCPSRMSARMTITPEGLRYLTVNDAYSLSGKPSSPKTIISIEDALNALKKSYSDMILTKQYTVKKIYLEYYAKQDADTTYKNARYTLIPYWCLEVEIQENNGRGFIQGERYNAFTGKDMADGG